MFSKTDKRSVCVCVCVCVCVRVCVCTQACVVWRATIYPPPHHGPKKRWRDCVVGDLSSRNVPLSSWMESAMDRPAWRSVCHSRPADALPPVPPSFHCHCGRSFRRSGDLKRHQNFCGLWFAIALWAGKFKVQGSRCVCAYVWRERTVCTCTVRWFISFLLALLCALQRKCDLQQLVVCMCSSEGKCVLWRKYKKK